LQNGTATFDVRLIPAIEEKDKPQITETKEFGRTWQSTVFVSSTPAPLTPEVANRMSQSILQLLQLLNSDS
jgi:hypothetical protein